MNADAKFSQAMALLQHGQTAAAEALLADVIRLQPNHSEAFHVLGVLTVQRGDATGGIELLRKALEIDPNHVLAHCNLGNSLRDLGQPWQALVCYGRALQLMPDFAGAHYNHGNALLDLNRVHEALDSFERALALQPDYPEVYNNRGNALRTLGRLEEALDSYQRAWSLQPDSPTVLVNGARVLRELGRHQDALAVLDRMLTLQPGDPEALSERGEILLELRRPEEALTCFDRAVPLHPQPAVALYNRGNAWLHMGRFDSALADYDSALQVKPDLAVAWCNRGLSLWGLDRQSEAVANLDQAVSLDPELAEAFDARGKTLRALNRHEEALADFERALELRPGVPDVLNRCAATLRDIRRYDEAARCYDELLNAAPDYAYAQGNAAHARLQICDWTGYGEYVSRIEESVLDGRRVCLPGHFLMISSSAAAQLQCARTFVADKHGAPLPALWTGERYRHDKIRVAYVSGDFRHHAVSLLMAGVFEQHDRERFETIAISLQPEEDSLMGQRIKAAFDRFIDVSNKNDYDVAALMREAEIDIAVDLMGFTGGNRNAIFAHRPAPVQVGYLGYPGTSAAPYIDYILGDEFVIPDAARQHYQEQVAHLPECFQANEERRTTGPNFVTRQEAGLPDSALVLCSFNTSYKINPRCFDIWMRLLLAVPTSVLWLVADDTTVEDNLRREAVKRGVEANRLIFARWLPYSEHLARMRCADLFLDTLPFNAGTTASDALWAGVPLLTCAGEAFAARMAGSLLTALGLSELITYSLEEYEALAMKLVTNPAMLSQLRDKLARNRGASPVFNAGRFCRHLESAYVTMHGLTQRGEAPVGFAVSAES
jgi:protein O-GlcNAc transferase